jgi:AcrR family transcriptional regulator
MKAARTPGTRTPATGARPPRPREEGNRRGGLIRVTGRLFREKGFDATTVRDIAEAAGMRSGSPFYHFKSKQEMLKAVMLEGLRDAQAKLEEAATGRRAPRQKLRAMVRVHLDAILGPGADFVPVLLYDWRSLPRDMRDEVVEARSRYEAVWDALLAELKGAGLVRDDGSITRLLILGAINWIVQWYRPTGKLSVDAIAGRVVEFVLGSARAAPRRRR